jgi:hypothetical protein
MPLKQNLKNFSEVSQRAECVKRKRIDTQFIEEMRRDIYQRQ